MSLKTKPAKKPVKKERTPEPEEFEFDTEDPEFIEVADLLRTWVKKNRLVSEDAAKADAGEAMASEFEAYVQEFHPGVAERVKRDVGIYLAVVLFWHQED